MEYVDDLDCGSGRLRLGSAANDSGALEERRLRELIDVGRALVAELDLEAVLSRVLEVACELTGARYAAVGVLDAKRHELERFITRGIDQQTREAIGALPRGRGVLGLLIEDPAPLRLHNVGDHPRSYGFPSGHPPMTSFLGVPIVIRGEAWGNLYLSEKAGGDFEEADEQSALILAEWTAIAVSNAHLYRDVEAQRDDLERAVRSLEATTEIARAVGGETDLDRILETIVKRGRALVEARSLLILLEERGELRVTAVAGEFELDPELRLPLAGSAPGQVVQSGRPGRLRNLGANLMSQPRSPGTGVGALLVPLFFRGQSLGVLVALDPLGEEVEFSPENEQVLQAFAASAATAVGTAQSVAEDKVRNNTEAAERERGRWARELHDEALQSMGGLRVLLSTARRAGAHGDMDKLLSEAIERVDHTIAEMRRLIADLRPATLDQLGLAAALEGLVERISAEGLAVKLRVDLAYEAAHHPTRLLNQVEEAVYRLVQEGLNNAAQHARAEAATVIATESDGEIRIQIEDGGRGFAPDQDAGFGLRGMRERVALAGGSLQVKSRPGAGTLIEATLPARHREQPSASSGVADFDAENGRAAES
jgi:two-component system, NarL family, sensor histidine kinase DevS